MIQNSLHFLELITSLIEKKDANRLYHVSVSNVCCEDEHGKLQFEIQYILEYYVVGPFKQDTKRNIKRNPVYLCERDVVKFIVHSLSDDKSPYFFDVNSGKFKIQRIVAG